MIILVSIKISINQEMVSISLSLRRRLTSNNQKFKTHKGLRKRLVVNSHGVKMKRVGMNKYATKKTSRRARRSKGLFYVHRSNLPLIRRMVSLRKLKKKSHE